MTIGIWRDTILSSPRLTIYANSLFYPSWIKECPGLKVYEESENQILPLI